MFEEKNFSSSPLVDVAVPVPIIGKSVLSYRSPEKLVSRLIPGVRVVVPVGRRKITGIFLRWNAGQKSDQPEKIKEILDIIDETPVFSQNLIQLWQWATGYYLTSAGEMLSLMLPGGMLKEEEIIVKVKTVGAKKKRGLSKSTQQETTTSPTQEVHFFVDKLSTNEKTVFMYLQERKRVSTKMLRRQFPHIRLTNILQRLEQLLLVEMSEPIHRRKETRKTLLTFLQKVFLPHRMFLFRHSLLRKSALTRKLPLRFSLTPFRYFSCTV